MQGNYVDGNNSSDINPLNEDMYLREEIIDLGDEAIIGS